MVEMDQISKIIPLVLRVPALQLERFAQLIVEKGEIFTVLTSVHTQISFPTQPSN